MNPEEPQKDFFISYNAADTAWVEWIAWELEEAGYQVVVQVWDFRPGGKPGLSCIGRRRHCAVAVWRAQGMDLSARIVPVIVPKLPAVGSMATACRRCTFTPTFGPRSGFHDPSMLRPGFPSIQGRTAALPDRRYPL